MSDEEDYEKQMRELEAALERLKGTMDQNLQRQRETARQVRDAVNAVPEMVSHAFREAALEQGQKLGNELSQTVSDAVAKRARELLGELVTAAEVQTALLRLQKKLFYILLVSVIFSSIATLTLIGGNAVVVKAYFDLLPLHPVQPLPKVVMPPPAEPASESSSESSNEPDVPALAMDTR